MPTFNLQNPSPHQTSLRDPLPKALSLRTPPHCDVWRKPPSTNDFNAPLLLRTISLDSLRSARVTVSANWMTKFDQGGLVLILPGIEGTLREQRQWVKTGVEFFEGRPNISTVACDRWADWSLAPVPDESSGKITVEITREVVDDKKTSTLWVHSVDSLTGSKRPLREIAWVFEDRGGHVDKDCEIGVYAAKPIPDEPDPENELEVCFEDLQIDQW